MSPVTIQPGPCATLMFREASEAADRVADQLLRNTEVLGDLAERLRAMPPSAVVTIARGSSDNAATYARYLIETRLGVLTASMSPSVSSVYAARPSMAGALCVAISQSGHSPDLLSAVQAARKGGAQIAALVNDAASPLAGMADVVVPLCAGSELSVAATKSFITSLTAIAQLVSFWSDDGALRQALTDLPDALRLAWDNDWGDALSRLQGAKGLYVLGRGPGFCAAQEAALKLKETCAIHAEAISSAEVRHGPMALIGPGFPVIAFVPDDEGREGVEAAVSAVRARGSEVVTIGGGFSDVALPACHPALTPIVQIQGFYRFAEALAAARGLDPDAPPHLAKVTCTR